MVLFVLLDCVVVLVVWCWIWLLRCFPVVFWWWCDLVFSCVDVVACIVVLRWVLPERCSCEFGCSMAFVWCFCFVGCLLTLDVCFGFDYSSVLCGFGGFGCLVGLLGVALVSWCLVFVAWVGRFLGLWFRWRLWLFCRVGVVGCSYWLIVLVFDGSGRLLLFVVSWRGICVRGWYQWALVSGSWVLAVACCFGFPYVFAWLRVVCWLAWVGRFGVGAFWGFASRFLGLICWVWVWVI